MPLVKVYLDKGSRSAEQRADLARKITDLIVKETGMPQQFTWVMIHEIPEEDWIVDRPVVTELKAKRPKNDGKSVYKKTFPCW